MLSVDLFANEDADANVVISETQSWTAQGEEVGSRKPAWFVTMLSVGVVCVHVTGSREGAGSCGR